MNRDEIDLLKMLAGDVQWALDHLAQSDTQTARRNLIRCLVSAAEGMSWTYRMNIMSMARHFDEANPLIEMAFAEASYAVTENGVIVEQARHISLTAMIRLTTRVAQTFCPEVKVDFGVAGWSALKKAISVRNRITHPKQPEDLLLSDDEIEAAKAGFFWFSDMAMGVMEAAIKTFAADVRLAKDLIEKYKSGDPDTLALFKRAHQGLDD
ncbi:hypothetical protein BV98_002993 [Sphingobium herbicidovorans NBRC 16415]|uniref:Uncharacterized protein n=1 Tax=Sphingobium herbicidovorans (strain ATCC 700291 / DSM 11019 / CCUG 56400 / KCTC 2939 / LMG 18315 / NBRC 16415 / MH) TaxID=1219045 RepID=A0A086P6Z8_SPHHM|nr:hypothetical protein [Sphingobium herbicidovorans]KFG89166.1 hypothetical protein BV98_002993 [Sphingobium herbicidovorans NBRC 16415]